MEIDVWDGEPPSSSESSSDEEEPSKTTVDASGKPKPWRADPERVEPVVLHGNKPQDFHHTILKDE